VVDHLERQIVLLLIGRVDFILSRRDFAPISGSRDLAIEIITGVAAHDI